jgi:selenophosphate synthase
MFFVLFLFFSRRTGGEAACVRVAGGHSRKMAKPIFGRWVGGAVRAQRVRQKPTFYNSLSKVSKV